MADGPVIIWFRRDFRLTDHPALEAACATGRAILPVFILDPLAEALGAAPKWRLEQALLAFDGRLRQRGSRLILRRGPAQQVLQALCAETGARAVHWTRAYDPDAIARDTGVKSALLDQGIAARSFPGHLLFEPWSVQTGSGTPYRVYTPFWKAVRGRDVSPALAAPAALNSPADWPRSDKLEDWQLGRAMQHGAEVLARYTEAGEAAAQDRLRGFCDTEIDRYADRRNLVAEPGTSGLSGYLSLGEIGPRQCWHAGWQALHGGARGAETFLKQLVWRDFASHLMYHTPHMLTRNWREGWDSFAWRTDPDHGDVGRWKQGRTGIRFVDAAMREMYVTGTMHNRARMIAASFLTKHMMFHWKIGMDWFADCLTDWDPASNAMGWQWVAGCGPDAAPFFRIFNPETQLEKFDPDGAYARRWIAEGQARPPPTAQAFLAAAPRSWGVRATDRYPDPMLNLKTARVEALEAYGARDF